MGWQMYFDPTSVFVTPNGTVTPPTVVSTPDARKPAPKGAFMTLTRVRGRITDDAAGPNPIAVGGNAAARLEIICRIKNTAARTGGYQVIGVMNGNVEFPAAHS